MNGLKKRFTKPDALLLCFLLFIAVAALPVSWWRMGKKGESVRVMVDGSTYGIYELQTNREIPIEVKGKITNTLCISDGQATMAKADCPDKLCMHQKAISRQGETIVCLPNRIVAEVVRKASAGEEAQYDSLSR